MTAATDSFGSAPDDPLPEPPLDGPGFLDVPAAARPDPTPSAPPAPYRVLARVWRPRLLDDLIGQDATVRVLRRAFATGRVAHAYLLTGTRGVGKTTTARIIARALCCIGPDGRGGPTADPCPDPATACANCRAIEADRHPDVLELDAASRTGIDDVREIIEATRFRPMQARGKVFIVDEVHMLSRNAFNALLKTLEEPPPHVTFVFATTELRKVPVTVLSRCQRFDLRRVPETLLAAHFGRIAAAEGATLAAEALRLLARAADGSVRDGLSLLDQAIATAAAAGGADGSPAPIDADAIAAMLGLADRGLVFDLADRVFAGDPAGALAIATALGDHGADPLTVLGDLLELVHLLGRLKAVPALVAGDALPELERTRGGALAARLGMATIGRAWQLLLKGHGEIEGAPDRQAAAEMVLLRLCHLAEVPTPAELLRRLDGGGGAAPAAGGSRSGGEGDGSGPPRAAAVTAGRGGAIALAAAAAPDRAPAPVRAPDPAAIPDAIPPAVARPAPRSWNEVVALLAAEARDPMLVAQLREWVRPVRVAPPVIELRPLRGAPRDLAARLTDRLARVLGTRWTVALSGEPGNPTLAERRDARRAAALDAARADPLVVAMLRMWPDAELVLGDGANEDDEDHDAGDGAPPLAGIAVAIDPDAPDGAAPGDDLDGLDPPDPAPA